MKIRLLSTVVALLAALLAPRHAHAYIDPSTGSYVLQIVVAGFLGAMFALKMFWHRIRLFLSGLFGRDSDSRRDAG